MPQKKITVSYIVAIYNVEKYLKTCLESVSKLKRDDCEIILVNDGSTDQSLAICQEYAKADDRIKIIDQPNSGVSVARNNGLEMATGDWIMYIDGDDQIYAEDIEKEIIPRLNLENDIVYYCYDDFKWQQTIRKTWPGKGKGSYIKDPSDITKLKYIIMDNNWPGVDGFQGIYSFSTPWGKAYKRSFLNEFQIRFKKGIIKGQDHLFNINVAMYARKIEFLPYYGYSYRRNDISISNRFSPKMLDYTRMLVQEFQSIVEAAGDNRLYENYSNWLAKQLYIVSKTYFCHSDNKSSYKTRRREFMDLSSTDEFKDCFHKINIRKFNGKNKLIAFVIKYKLFFVLNFYLRFIFKYSV